MKYKVILFDADETLFNFKKTEKVALEKLMDSLDTEHDKEYCIKLYKEINSKIWKDFEEGKIKSDDINLERFKRLLLALELDADAKYISDQYSEFLGEGSYLFEETEELLAYLHQNYRIGIITNGLAEVQHKRIRESVVSHYFEDVVISDEIKIAKPNSEIFDYALNNLNHRDKSSVLMIGDSLTSDIKGGINAGIDTCWCNLYKKENTSDLVPSYEINSLLDLKNIL